MTRQSDGGAILDINNINHVGLAVRSLSKTSAHYEAMGFQLTPYSPQSAAWRPGEAVQPLGSGNRCIMFQNTYLEILGSETPAQQAPRIENFLKRHQGAHIICFDCGDCNLVDRRLRGLGVDTSGVLPLQREVDTPEGRRTARFERVQFSPQHSPEGYIQATRHLTPEYIYQPRYLEHPNGAFQLAEAVLLTDDLEGMAEKYSRYLAAPPVRTRESARFDLALGTVLTILGLRYAENALRGTLFPPIPGIAAVTFRVTELDKTRKRLRAQGFTVTEINGRIMVPAEEASGVAVIFGT